MNNSTNKVVSAAVAGIVVGLITALVIYIIDRLLGLDFEPRFWGVLIGVLYFVYLLVSSKDTPLR